MDDRCVTTAVFVKGVVDLFYNFIGVMHCPYCRKLLRCHLTSTSKHMEGWRSAVDKIKSRTFLNKESEAMHPPPSQAGWLITIRTLQHVWRKVSEEQKFKYPETRNLNEDALENTFYPIHLCCGSNDNLSVGKFVDDLKTVIINGLAYMSL